MHGPLTPERLRRWRLWRRMTQRQAAAWYGTTERTWRRWENGEVPIGTPLVRRLERAPFPMDKPERQDTET